MIPSKRLSRQWLVVLVVIIVVIYLPLNLLYIFFAAPRAASNEGRGALSGREVKVAVQITDVSGDPYGNVNVALSLNINELLMMLEGRQRSDADATRNPPPGGVRMVINNPDICSKSPKVKYIVYVHTSPENAAKRDLLRATWINRSLFSERIIERIFLMGRSKDSEIQERIAAEAKQHGDIVQGDFVDNYKNLTLKALMGLRWVSAYCKQAQFAIKADDDAFVNIFRLLRVLDQYRARRRLVACPLWGANSMPILRDPTKCAKWCVKFDEFPGQRYFPKYCAGLTFVLSNDLVPLLYNASRSTPFFWIDDVYVTGLLPAKVKDVEYISLIKNFTLKQDEATAQLKNTNATLTHLFVHAKKKDEYLNMWRLLLKRLSFDDVKLLSTDVIEGNADLKKIISSGKVNNS